MRSSAWSSIRHGTKSEPALPNGRRWCDVRLQETPKHVSKLLSRYGLARCPSIPDSRARTASSSKASAVNARMGTRRVPLGLAPSDLARRCVTVHHRHLTVHENDIYMPTLERRDRFVTV